MSINVEKRVIPSGDDGYADAAWELKERIRSRDDVLKQRRAFFMRAYRRARVHAFVEGDDLLAFAAARSDGYVLFLAVDPEYRGEGFGERLVGSVADECGKATCHARVSNESALGFYDHLGFERVRYIDNYYEDGGDAYYLRLGDEAPLLDRLSGFLRR